MILEREPAPVSTAVPTAPPALEQLIRSCLVKDPAERRQTMHDVLVDLRWIAQGGSTPGLATPPPPQPNARAGIWMAAAAILALATVTLAVLYWRRPLAEARVLRFSLPPPDKSAYGFGLAVSPDGTRVAFVAATANGQSALWVRALDSLSAQPIAGSEGASYPFWSPDNRFLGFFAEGKLKKVGTAGGPIQVLCDAPDPRGASWSQEGVILLAPATNLPLMRVPAAGGTPVAVTRIDAARKEVGHRWPHFLPDGRHYLCFTYCGNPAGNAIAAGSLDSEDLTIPTVADSGPAYGPPDYVFYVKSNVLMAQPFDASRLRLAGDAVPFAQDVAAEGEAGPTAFARFSLSRNGVLAYVTGSGTTGQFTWFDRSGKPLWTITDPGSYGEPALAPNQRRVIFSWPSPLGNNLWVFDFSQGVKSRFSFGSTFDASAVWSPDGSRVAFASRRGGASDIYLKPATGAGTEDLLFSSKVDKIPDSWSADGRTLVFESLTPKNRLELWMLSLDGRQASPYLQTEFSTGQSALSPDGHWIAYTSDETGRLEVYVQSFPIPAGGRYPISPAGGDQPSWRRDGKELFYLAQDRKLMAVPVTTGASFASQAPRALFQCRVDRPLLSGARNYYVAAADGQKFLVYTLSDALTSSPMTAVINWSSGMGK